MPRAVMLLSISCMNLIRGRGSQQDYVFKAQSEAYQHLKKMLKKMAED